jgi:biotin operon repressor
MKQTNLVRLINLLKDGSWHPAEDLAHEVSWRFGATIHEARQKGYQIETRRISHNQHEYRLPSA